MPTEYNDEVADSNHGSFLRILIKWKGSVWKACKVEIAVWLLLYYAIAAVYRLVLNHEQKVTFELLVQYMDHTTIYIPIDILVSFFVDRVFHRWTEKVYRLPQIDNLALDVSVYMQGDDDESRMARRSVVRYACASQVLVFRDISVKVRSEYERMTAVVDKGLLLEEERHIYERHPYRHHKSWIPMKWAMSAVHESRFPEGGQKPRIANDVYATVIMGDLSHLHSQLRALFVWDWVPMPLMYPQIVSLGIHIYFAFALLSRQFITTTLESEKHPDASRIDLYFPIISVLQLLFFFSWVKVAEMMLNPYGDDDDDLDTIQMIDRNMAMSLTAVDGCSREMLSLEWDGLSRWDEEGETVPLYDKGCDQREQFGRVVRYSHESSPPSGEKSTQRTAISIGQ